MCLHCRVNSRSNAAMSASVWSRNPPWPKCVQCITHFHECSALPRTWLPPGTGGAQCPQLCHQDSAMQGSGTDQAPGTLPTPAEHQNPPCTLSWGSQGPMAQRARSAHVANSTLVFVWEFRLQGAGQSLVPSPHGSPSLRQRTHQEALTLLQHRKPKGRARAEVAGAVAGVEFA